MELLIVRHGIAGDRLQWEGPDAERPLTPNGVERTREAARGLLALGCRPDRIGTSPFVRAAQTAEIMADVLCPDAPIEACRFLAIGASSRRVAAWLRELADETVMIVGHMPSVAEMVTDFLCTGAIIEMTFKKAGVCCISFDDRPALGAGRLEWFLQPRQLRAIAGRREA